jgi:pyruvate dehydrogenase E2 component (dihydrolipoamide acetyltransferase)
MAQILGLPKLSPTMEEGVLVRWTKKEGDKVSPGDLIAEVETDKANMDFNVEDAGVLLKFLVKEGETVKLGAPVAIIGKAGEDITALLAEASGGGASGATPSKDAASKDASSKDASAKEASSSKAVPASESPGVAAKQAPAKASGSGSGSASGSATASGAKSPSPRPTPTPTPTPTKTEATGKILASPLAKTLAIELGIDLRGITGTGPGGRIVERDVKAAADGGGASTAQANGHAPEEDAPHDSDSDSASDAPTQALAVRHARQLVPDASAGEFEDIPASNMRKRIAARLTEAKRDVPHFYLMRKLDAAPLLGFRQRLNELLGDRGKVSVNDLVIKAVALALRRVPECNASWEGDAIRRYHQVHIGVAVAIEDGLVTPVIRNADQKGIGSIAAEVKDLAERAKKRQLKGHEITGSTFTVSNLGMYGIERFTAIINPPEAGILAIGTTVDEPVIAKDGQIVAGKRMTVTMSCDHRVIDGALGARWLQAFGDLFEKPESLAL